ncbi:Cytochrome P450 monooxygenase 98 [Psilocybe cubensis]|uniref:Cytochrome P450 monooxygenase 98 n=1 Tax=Psilocybe cubensis TaxID=181762 RepID=A0ACB8GMC2_PSICU|nr:Cytochrome P450 monooxygenase 98 [Psilocybe cubensis]KAH9476853.1 Cytochrome P450 monooxygenase 98 [Psilocybe cubensis]
MAAETIMSVTYGLDVQPHDDPYIQVAEHGVEGFSIAAVPGTFLVDAIPALKYVPEWCPGASFKRKAREWKRSTISMIETPFAAAKKIIADGTSPHSMVCSHLRQIDGRDPEQEEVVKHAAGTMYAGKSINTLSALASCILGLLERPEVMKKAQEELDRVIKPGHLPEFEDQDSLHYITAIAMEALRWRAIVPIGIPHLVTVEDEYKGYRIPAGSIVIANSWAMLHHEKTYPDPFTFNPDRFMKDGKLNSAVRDPAHACWGFGRRICPGRYLAYSSIWITLASMLAVFDIEKATDKDGNVIELTHEYFPALISVPRPYECSIKPRSKEAEKLIRTSAMPELNRLL